MLYLASEMAPVSGGFSLSASSLLSLDTIRGYSVQTQGNIQGR